MDRSGQSRCECDVKKWRQIAKAGAKEIWKKIEREAALYIDVPGLRCGGLVPAFIRLFHSATKCLLSLSAVC